MATPKKRRWYHNYADAFRLVWRHEPAWIWAMVATGIGTIAAGVVVGALMHSMILSVITAVLLAVIFVLLILVWRVRKVSYQQIDGQPGATLAVLDEIKRGWNIEQEPVAINAKTQDMVFRMVGKPGIVLLSEGPTAAVGKLLRDEARRAARVAPNVPIHQIQVGHREGQVPLTKLQWTVKRLPKKLNSQEVAAVSKRLRSLGTASLPIPKGVDPFKARPDRKAQRGR